MFPGHFCELEVVVIGVNVIVPTFIVYVNGVVGIYVIEIFPSTYGERGTFYFDVISTFSQRSKM